ncbi:hypothetical protein LIER_11879 [Lithospermum erythrorhizon]|uniref:Uncharacterized protein n=1 Tax=Lithospermum erythrorhizon TaxID=34254 RepID=A0AAV3PS10_LITER
MEDLNMLAADCLVVSCCCQCLILQILIFLVLKVPHKLFRRMKEYVRKLRTRKREQARMQRERSKDLEDSFPSLENSFRVLFEGLATDECHSFGSCMREVENELEELSRKGAFSFGSFNDQELRRSLSSCLADDDLDYDVLRYHLIKTFGISNIKFI